MSEHSWQQQKWPHGSNRTDRSFSKHTTHSRKYWLSVEPAFEVTLAAATAQKKTAKLDQYHDRREGRAKQ
jgi:hypothetical protein